MQHMPHLDGLRAFAISAVLVEHFGGKTINFNDALTHPYPFMRLAHKGRNCCKRRICDRRKRDHRGGSEEQSGAGRGSRASPIRHPPVIDRLRSRDSTNTFGFCFPWLKPE